MNPAPKVYSESGKLERVYALRYEYYYRQETGMKGGAG